MMKMKKICGLVTLLAVSALPALAQGFETNTPTVEVGAGYGFRSWGAPAAGNGRTNMNGWNADANYNLNRLVGIAFDAAGTGQTVTSDGFTYTQRINTFMAGPRLFPVGHHKLTPFVHVMAGLGRYWLSFPGEDYSENHLAFGFGGGVDATVNRMIAVRVLQIDYERTVFTLDQAFPAQNNLRFSTGVVFRFGGR
jgi:hypothetical protein